MRGGKLVAEKKKYDLVQLEICNISEEDVITTSSTPTGRPSDDKDPTWDNNAWA